jgi:biopolymer transport protein ExbD
VAKREFKQGSPVDVTLPITPMLDMSFQLLFYFVMTFQSANAMEGHIDMMLPRGGTPQAKKPDQVDLTKDSDVDLAQQGEITVEVTSRRGEINGLTIREKTKSTTVPALKVLRPMLQKVRTEQGGTGTRISILADSRLKYARLIDVMDACLAVGFKTIEFAPPPDLR